MNRTGDPVANVEAARDLAARISGARFVELPGDTHSLTGMEPDRILSEIRTFVTGVREHISGARVLSTIACVDIVESTQKAARLGDRRWRVLLDRYYDLLELHLASY